MSNLTIALNEGVYRILESNQLMTPLHTTAIYRAAHERQEAAYAALGTIPSDSPLQELVDSMNRTRDLELQYLYRMGIQDGMVLSQPAFLVEGIA